MSSKPKRETPQSKRFIEAARDAEASEDEAVFDENLKRVVTAKAKSNKSAIPGGQSLNPKAMTEVSVLMTVYNGENYIQEAVKSALSQAFDSFEVVVVDDGSIDLTLEKLAEIADDRLRIFRPGRLGRIKALNFGLNNCRGDYVAILDADDVALAGRLEAQVNFLKSDPVTVLVGSAFRSFIDETGKEIGENNLPTDFTDIVAMLQAGQHPFFHSSVMFRRDAVLAFGGYDESLPCYEDLDLYAKLAERFKMANLPIRLSLKRIHGKQFFAASDGVIYSPEGREALARVVGRISALLPRRADC